MKKHLLTLLCLLLCSVLFAQTYRNGSDKGLNLRSEPNANATVVASIPSNAKVTVVDKSNSEWYKVRYDGKTGYVSSKYISEDNNQSRNNNSSNSNNNSNSNSGSKKNNSSKSASKSNSSGGSTDYNTGIGVRFGGWETGFTIKHFFRGNAAIEGIISSGWHHRGTRITGLYEVQKPLGGDGFYWFWGVGGHLGFYNGRYWDRGDCKDGKYWHKGDWYNCDGTRAVLGIDGIIGLEYKFRGAPLTLGIDFKPSIDILGWGSHYGDGGFSVRYVF